MRPRGRTTDEIIGALASRSHGVVTHAMLTSAGITQGEIKHRRASGALLTVHPCVYRVGHRACSPEATYLAAVWACGQRALLCGRAAAYLWGLIKANSPPPAEVVAPTERRVRGVRTRRSRSLSARDATTCRGVPVTTVARTVVDLASVLSLSDLGRAVHEAEVKYGMTPIQVEAALASHPTTKGARNLRVITRGDERISLSKLESRFLELCTEAGLPLPQMNCRVGTRRVDCRWQVPPLTVELDGYRFHRSRHAWEQDRHREREARARGDDFRRYTYGDVFEDPRYMLAELRGLLIANRPA